MNKTKNIAEVSAQSTEAVAKYVPLSYGQERMWFMEELLGGGVYNIANRRLLRGRLDVAAFERSVSEIVRRH